MRQDMAAGHFRGSTQMAGTMYGRGTQHAYFVERRTIAPRIKEQETENMKRATGRRSLIAQKNEGKEVDALFSIGKLLSPAHPQCRCAVEHEEIPMPMQAASGGLGLGNFLERYTDRQGSFVGGAGKEGLNGMA